jgi:hypothetical protein
MNCLRRNHGEAAGAEPGAYPVNRTAVNVGTVRVRSPAFHHPGGRPGIGATPAEGADGTEPP